VFIGMLQEQLTAKDNSLSFTNGEIDRLNQEISRLDRLCHEKTEDTQRLTTDLDNYRRDLEVSRVCMIL
jgi:molecular chaperone GrpE (heat shock protein)